MARAQLILDINDGLIVVLFAGGGGMCHAIERAFGRHVDIACNHNANALAVHRINNPQTKHYVCDVFELDPHEACGDRPVALVHGSSDCTDHSQSAAGQPRDVVSRCLSWVMLMWMGKKKPKVVTWENVKRLRKWGPCIAKRCEVTGRCLKIDPETRKVVGVAAPGERVPVREQFLIADPKREGQRYRRLLSLASGMGYDLGDADMVAADYGTPTTRDRLFFVARRDSEPVVFPVKTHAKKPKRPLKRWRSAAEVIDWTLPVPSIFSRPRPLVEATCRRIARGIVEQVLLHPNPFVVNGAAPLVAPICQTNGGNRVTSAAEPFPTMTARPKGGHLALCAAFMAQHNGGNYADNAGRDVRDPLSVITTSGNHHALVNCNLGPVLTPEEEAGALRCAAFIMRYYSTGGQLGSLRMPMPTATTKDRLALVTVWIGGWPRVIWDIGMRMFAARELFNGMGFSPSYIIDQGDFELPDGTIERRKITSTVQKELVGNAVAIEPAMALLLANCPHLVRVDKERRTA